jgi:two-component system KDP operon response regulator KdpE
MPNGRIHTLLVTPDEQWRLRLYMHLAENNFELIGKAADATSALTLFREVYVDLVIIDTSLPDADGLALCQLMQTLRPTIKVVLTAKDDASLQLVALQANASGCINRDLPVAEWASLLTYVVNGGGTVFSQEVVKEVLAGAWLAKSGATIVSIGPLVIDVACRQVTLSGQPIFLTPREFALLACLARNLGRVVTFDQLLNEAWGYESEIGTPAQVRLYITRLRRKLGDDPDSPGFIITERGVGYRLRSPAQWRHRSNPDRLNIFYAATPVTEPGSMPTTSLTATGHPFAPTSSKRTLQGA